MILTLLDRFAINQVLPTQSQTIEMRIVKEIRDRTFPNASERKQWEVRDAGEGNVSWNMKTNTETELTFSKIETSLITNRLRMLDEKGKITLDQLGIWDKFCENPDGSQ